MAVFLPCLVAWFCSHLQISGIHVSQTHLKTVVITDRSDRKNGFLALDWSTNPPWRPLAKSWT